MFHISDLKRYVRCPHLYWHSLHQEKEPFNSFVRLDEEITALAATKLGVTDAFQGLRSDPPERALAALDNYEWLVKARFEYSSLRVKVPFLHKTKNGFDLYFLFCGNFPHEDDMQFYCNTAWVLKKNNIQLNNYYIIHFNNEYVRQDELDCNALFVVSDCFYNDHGHPTKTIKTAIKSRMKDIEPIMAQMKDIESIANEKPVRMSRCTRRSKCLYYDLCFKEEVQEPDDSILTLMSSQYKYQMFKDGRKLLKDVDLSLIEGSRQQFAQIRAGQSDKGYYVDYFGLQTWMEKMQYPLVFLDFEWDTYAVPPFKGLKPYEVVPFEYSIHILDAKGNISHKEFIGTKDCREDFITSLINDIPQSGTIIAYNADGAEKLRLKELGVQFPRYEKQLLAFNQRMVDLQFPFSIGLVYDVRMRGLYSLKVLMNILDDTGYTKLDIRQGMQAVFEWRQVDRDEDVDSEAILKNLSAYCGMDSYSMIVVFEWLKKLLKDNVNKS